MPSKNKKVRSYKKSHIKIKTSLKNTIDMTFILSINILYIINLLWLFQLSV